MAMKTHSTLLAGMICTVLCACSTTERSAMNDNTYGPEYGAYSATGAASASGSAAPATGSSGTDMSRSAAMNPSGVVLTIEAIPRSQASGATSGSAASSGSSSGAATGGSAADIMYRITLRQDDGTTMTIQQEAQPAVQIGDRARMENGVLQRY